LRTKTHGAMSVFCRQERIFSECVCKTNGWRNRVYTRSIVPLESSTDNSKSMPNYLSESGLVTISRLVFTHRQRCEISAGDYRPSHSPRASATNLTVANRCNYPATDVTTASAVAFRSVAFSKCHACNKMALKRKTTAIHLKTIYPNYNKQHRHRNNFHNDLESDTWLVTYLCCNKSRRSMVHIKKERLGLIPASPSITLEAVTLCVCLA
jgi:hypothetical protein